MPKVLKSRNPKRGGVFWTQNGVGPGKRRGKSGRPWNGQTARPLLQYRAREAHGPHRKGTGSGEWEWRRAVERGKN